MFDCQVDTPPWTPSGSAILRRHVVLVADGQPYLAHGQPGLDRVHRAASSEHREDVVARHGLGPHGAELPIEAGPEFLQAHPTTLTRPGLCGRRPAYPRRMLPGTGSGALDVVLQIAIAVALLVSIVLLIKNLRGR